MTSWKRLLLLSVLPLRSFSAPVSGTPVHSTIDRDLAEVSIQQLETFYKTHRYTVTQVVEWYIARIGKYNGIYQAIENEFAKNALALAAKEDAEAEKNPGLKRLPLWGVPIVIKANTSIKGRV